VVVLHFKVELALEAGGVAVSDTVKLEIEIEIEGKRAK